MEFPIKLRGKHSYTVYDKMVDYDPENQIKEYREQERRNQLVGISGLSAGRFVVAELPFRDTNVVEVCSSDWRVKESRQC